VESVVEGTHYIEEFVPEGKVITSSHGLEEPMEERAQRYTKDFYRFNGDCCAVYEGSSSDVTKYVSWREKYATVGVNDPKSSYKRASSGGPVDEVFDGITDLGVRIDSGGVEEMDDATKQRLEDLGYV
jgi:arylsulfatase